MFCLPKANKNSEVSNNQSNMSDNAELSRRHPGATDATIEEAKYLKYYGEWRYETYTIPKWITSLKELRKTLTDEFFFPKLA